MSYIIRNAQVQDYKSVIGIMNQVQKMHVEWRPDIYKDNETLISMEAFANMVKDGAFYVAEKSGLIVGVMEIIKKQIESPAHVTRNILFIASMGVDEKFRGKGVGHLFFEEVKRMKKTLQYDAIELQVNAKNKAAYEMYSKLGFTDKSIHMELIF